MQPGIQAEHPLEKITTTQRMVLYLIAQGNNVKQISGLLGVSRRTIAYHVSSAKIRMRASTRDEVIAIAVMDGILDETKTLA
jgi:DNA-binding NarL/FixJ family response regulator